MPKKAQLILTLSQSMEAFTHVRIRAHSRHPFIKKLLPAVQLLSIRVHFTAGYHCLRNAHSRIQLPEYLWFMQALSAHLLLTRVEVVTIVCARDSYVLPSDFSYKTVVRCLLILKNHTSRHARCF